MRLANAGQAVIPAAKLRDYILSQTHPVGRYKAAFFEGLGYKREEWQVLDRDLREQHLSLDALEVEGNEFGRKFIIQGPFSGPAGVADMLVSVWIVLYDESAPRFVTAYPGGS